MARKIILAAAALAALLVGLDAAGDATTELDRPFERVAEEL